MHALDEGTSMHVIQSHGETRIKQGLEPTKLPRIGYVLLHNLLLWKHRFHTSSRTNWCSVAYVSGDQGTYLHTLTPLGRGGIAPNYEPREKN